MPTPPSIYDEYGLTKEERREIRAQAVQAASRAMTAVKSGTVYASDITRNTLNAAQAFERWILEG